MKSAEVRKAELLARRGQLTRRMEGIEAELDAHSSPDWEELAIERETDEVLEDLGNSAQHEIRMIDAALKRWENADVEGLMRQIDPIEDPRERLTALFRRTSHEMRTHVIYSALLNTLDHPAVQPVMQQVPMPRATTAA